MYTRLSNLGANYPIHGSRVPEQPIYFTGADPLHKGNELVEAELRPVAGICTGAGFDVVLVILAALIARTT